MLALAKARVDSPATLTFAAREQDGYHSCRHAPARVHCVHRGGDRRTQPWPLKQGCEMVRREGSGIRPAWVCRLVLSLASHDFEQLPQLALRLTLPIWRMGYPQDSMR